VGGVVSVAEGEVEVSVVEAAVAAVGSLPVAAGGVLLPEDAAEVNFTLFSINEFTFYKALYYIKVLHRNFLPVPGSAQGLLELISGSIYPQNVEFQKVRSTGFELLLLLNMLYFIAREAW